MDGEGIGIDLTLANGKGYSIDNLDLDVLMNMKNIHRGNKFAGVPPHDNFNLLDHSLCCFLIGNLYFEYLEENGENEIVDLFADSLVDKWGKGIRQLIKSYFTGECFTHDFQEVVTGDLVPSFKTDEYREKEDIVKEDIDNFLEIYKRKDTQGIMKKHIKIVDVGAALYEIKKLEEKGYKSVSRMREETIKRMEKKGIEYDEIKDFYGRIKVLPDDYEIE